MFLRFSNTHLERRDCQMRSDRRHHVQIQAFDVSLRDADLAMTVTRLPHQGEHGLLTMHSLKFCRGRPGYSYTRRKHVCGTLRESVLFNLADLGPDVWNPRGIKILGTPVGSQKFIPEVCKERLQQERKLWEAIPWVAWQV